MASPLRPRLPLLLPSRSYATTPHLSPPPFSGGAIKILRPGQPTVKNPTSKKSTLHADYVHYYSSNPTLLICQHNNLTQSAFLKIRGDLASSHATLRVIRVGIFEHAVGVARAKMEAGQGSRVCDLDVNSKVISALVKRSKKKKRHDGVVAGAGNKEGLDVAQLLTGPICAITFTPPSDANASEGGTRSVAPGDLKKVIGIIQATAGKLLLVGGKFEGQVFAVDALDRVSKLPALEILQGQVLSLLGAPAARLSQVLGMSAGSLSRTLEGRKVAMEEEQGKGQGESQVGDEKK